MPCANALMKHTQVKPWVIRKSEQLRRFKNAMYHQLFTNIRDSPKPIKRQFGMKKVKFQIKRLIDILPLCKDLIFICKC